MGLDANRRRSDPRAILSGRLRSGGGRLAARPAEVLARLDDSDQVRRDLVALVVALVDGRPQQARAGLNGQTNRIAQPPGKALILATVGCKAQHRRASLVGLVADVARGSDRDVHRPIRAEDDGPRRVAAAWKIGYDHLAPANAAGRRVVRVAADG